MLQLARSAALCARRGSRESISPPRRSSRTSTATTSRRIGPTRRGLPSTGARSVGPPRCRCARRRASGVLVPGAEDAVQYTENPGEGWAEGYRVLNEHKAGRPETPWQIVDQALYPTAAALTAAEQDVTTPWETGTTTTQTAALTRTKKTQIFTVATPTRRQLADVSENVGRDARFRLTSSPARPVPPTSCRRGLSRAASTRVRRPQLSIPGHGTDRPRVG